MANEREYRLMPGETLFIEGKHGIIAISTFTSYTTVTASDKTDTKRTDARPS